MKKRIIINKMTLLLFISIVSVSCYSQQIILQGTIYNGYGGGLSGVTISIMSNNAGTQTDISGNYSLNCQMGDSVEISYPTIRSVCFIVQDVIQNIYTDETTGEVDDYFFTTEHLPFKKRTSNGFYFQGQDNKKYVMWFSPSNATDVYGLMLVFFPREARFPRYNVYGAEVNLNPLGLFLPPMMLLGLFEFESYVFKPVEEMAFEIDLSYYSKTIYGLQTGTANVAEPYIIYGLDISLGGNYESVVNGVSVSLIRNEQDVVNGLTFATFGNTNLRCRGVQVGLFNASYDLRGFQIGLWNVNQKRRLPLINWNFKRTKEKETK